MKTIGVVTGARSEYGIYVPILRRIEADPDLRLHLIVSGAHLSPEFGMTVRLIEADGFVPGDRVEALLSSDSPEGVAKSMGLGVIGYAQSFARVRPDILVILGDRYETHAAAVAALPARIPVAHIHGGELTFGAIDDSLRHSMTKLSHLHFVSTEEYGRRVIQMGEEPWRVTVSGAPGLDNLAEISLMSQADLEERFGLRLTPAPLLVTFHPVTTAAHKTEEWFGELLLALDEQDTPIVFTLPNADTGGRVIIGMIHRFVSERPGRAFFVDNLGTRAYFSLMAISAAMVGNSSSGIIEAASFKLPVVNIGDRQDGRVKPRNVVDSGHRSKEIAEAVRLAVSPDFKASLRDLVNPYGDGHASERIVSGLKKGLAHDGLMSKRFFDIPVPAAPGAGS